MNQHEASATTAHTEANTALATGHSMTGSLSLISPLYAAAAVAANSSARSSNGSSSSTEAATVAVGPQYGSTHVYVAPDRQGAGIGSALLPALIARCEALGYRQMIAVIGDSANAGSIGVHSRCGFQMIGTHPNVGFKFGRWLDTVMMQRPLGDGAGTLPATA